MKLLSVLPAVVLFAIAPLEAQTFRWGVHSVAMTYRDQTEDREADGVGIGGVVALQVGRFGIEATGWHVNLDPDASDLQSFDLLQGDVRASFLVASGVALEVGAGRRDIDPEFATQDVGYGRIGIFSERPLARIARIRVRGAYLIAPSFNGGGDANFSIEIGMGVAIGTPNGRFRLRAESEFQRMDREVNNVEVPIQVTLAKLGVEFGF
ncbi:MAG: hypothetical protein ACE5HT_14435 [Gemmatimonadales bacterium]